MGKKKSRNGKGNNNRPQSMSAIPVNLTQFQPFRRILIATETDLSVATPTKVLAMQSSAPPGSAILSCESFLAAFDRTRVVYIDVFFDQRGSASTAAIPRATAFCADMPASSYLATRLSSIASFAGSGMSQVVPGKRFRINVGPRYQMGQFAGINGALFLISKDYNGTVRMETCFEGYGPPLDYTATASGGDGEVKAGP